jgi:hypothetical protein
MKVHELKIDIAPFTGILNGDKLAEFRVNDRDFKYKDILHLREYADGEYTGNDVICQITHIQTGHGIPEGYAMLSIKRIA